MFLSQAPRALLCASAISLAVFASPIQAESTLSPGLRSLIFKQLAEHPEILAAESAVGAAQARLEASGRAIYNPELELDGQRTNINTFEIGLSQSLDINNKQQARTALAMTGLAQARAELGVARIDLAGTLLSALLDCSGSRSLLDLSQEQSDLLERFFVLIQRRGTGGDVGSSEVKLAHLAKLEAVLNQARQQAIAHSAQQVYLSLSEQNCPASSLFPLNPAVIDSHDDIDQLATAHPRVQSSLALARMADAQVLSTDRERKADPTLGLRLGREDKEDLVGISLSMPLNVRNDFRSEVDVQRAIAQGAYARAKLLHRQLRADISGSQLRLHNLYEAWQKWQSGDVAHNNGESKELERLWRAGELNTADYLQQLQQNLTTRIAAQSLHNDLWQAWIDLKRADGSLTKWFDMGAAR